MSDVPSSILIGGLTEEQVTELQYRVERAIPAHIAAIHERVEGMTAVMLFADELTLMHLMTREKTREIAVQLMQLAGVEGLVVIPPISTRKTGG